MSKLSLIPQGCARVRSVDHCGPLFRRVRSAPKAPHGQPPAPPPPSWSPRRQHLDREHTITVHLDTRHRLIATSTTAIGNANHTNTSPREIYRDALHHGANAIMVAHNHPSGDAEPSPDDKTVTKRVEAAGDLLGIPLLDHLIIGHNRWVSLARRDVI